MTRFNPSMLVPVLAGQTSSAARSAKEVALDNINKMKAQYAAGDDAEGKINFKKVDGGRIAFTIRVSNTALVLGQYEQDGVQADVKEMTVPAANFTDALTYFAEKVNAGDFDVQLAALSEKKEARTAKLRTTRANKKAAEPAK